MKQYRTVMGISLLVAFRTAFSGILSVQHFTEFNDLGSTGFGHAVSCAGDVNQDNFDDILIGAPYYDSGTGRAMLFYGGSTPDSLPDLIFHGEGGLFGAAVSCAGDINGDGYDDMIIGAENYNNNTGRVYLYYGGSSVDNEPDLIFDGAGTNHWFGTAIDGVGDVNHDGFDDLLIGCSGFGNYTGRTYLYLGSASPDTVADAMYTGQNTGDQFGESVSGAGDINGDGYDDFLIGSKAHNSSAGRIAICFGAGSLASVTILFVNGSTANDQFGDAVASAGDVNHDGYDDILAGASGASSSTGSVTLFLGGAAFDVNPDEILTGEGSDHFFGASISAAGDLNHDGYADFIVGAYGYSGNTGRAYVYLGSATVDGTPDLMLTGESSGNYFGQSLTCAGLFNGDLYSDILVGAPEVQFYTGRSYLYFGQSAIDSNADLLFEGEGTDNYFGFSVSGAGDVNGDGYRDMIAGAYGYHQSTGRAYLYQGSTTPDATADLIFEKDETNSAFGRSVCGAGDVNGDGFDDVMISAPERSNGAGRVCLYYGGALMDTVADVVFDGEGENDDFGWSLAGSADVNGDGYDDILIGAVGYEDVGRVYLFLGGKPMDLQVDLVITGESGREIGESIAMSGSVNGDVYDDILVGASNAALIYYGSASPDNGIDVLIPGGGGSFGATVSGCGDLNGDGFDDIVIGAKTLNSFTGRIYIYFGGNPMDNLSDYQIDGEGVNHLFGCSLSGLGDINQDGYNDFICGAYGVQNYRGRAYLYLGGDPVDTQADFIIESEADNDRLGIAVSGTGDTNGDYIPDLVIGASYHGDNHNGKVYLYTGFVYAQVKVWLQGPYHAGTMNTELSDYDIIPLASPYGDLTVESVPANITDWVLIQLRSDPAGPVVSQRSFFIRNDGMVVDTDGLTTQLKLGGAPDGSYYIAVFHRNHPAVMSAGTQWYSSE
jgi:hypothetical protein